LAKRIWKVTLSVAAIGIFIVAFIIFVMRVQVATLFSQEKQLI
jgi:hypothetical protein